MREGVHAIATYASFSRSIIAADTRFAAIDGLIQYEFIEGQAPTDEQRQTLVDACENIPGDRILIAHDFTYLVETAFRVDTAQIPDKAIVFVGTFWPMELSEVVVGLAITHLISDIAPGVYVIWGADCLSLRKYLLIRRQSH
jgi:hypothetical protein